MEALRAPRMPFAVPIGSAARGSTDRWLSLWPRVGPLMAVTAPFVVLMSAVLWLGTAAAGFSLADPGADYALGIACGTAILFGFAFGPFPRQHRRALVILWLVHLAVALGLMLAYESYYGLDAAGYFNLGIR